MTHSTKLWKTSTLVLAGTLAYVVASGSTVPEAQAEKQPRMRAALSLLQKAESQLKNASHDKGGHRVKALAATRTAISQVRKGIAHDNGR
jgi:hypothetical protein